MSLTKSIGKNTLGGGQKMSVDLKTYNRSTHDLSFAWRSTMGVGTLVPCLKLLATPGDEFDIQINQKVMTHPTVGPLFGSYKFQVDVFTCPIRLYNAMLHNNAIGVGLDMSKVKLPKIQATIKTTDNPTDEDKWSQVHPSSVLAYLGIRGWGYNGTSGNITIKKNGVPLLAYMDIGKCYYANKQEDKYWAIMPNSKVYTNIDNTPTYTPETELWQKGFFLVNNITREEFQNLAKAVFTSESSNGRQYTYTYEEIIVAFTPAWESNSIKFTYQGGGRPIIGLFKSVKPNGYTKLKSYKLQDIDDLREWILKQGRTEVIFNAGEGGGSEYLKDILARSSKGILNTKNPSSGLLLKTHQSDIFNNWVNTEWLDGDNGINAVTAIDTSSGEFTIDTLNLAKKVYDMLNRIAVSGGTYEDWIETVWTSEYQTRAETPIYEGGMSCEIEFDEVVSNSAATDQPLGTLAGRGKDTQKDGGNVHIKVSEPSYIIGIASITPRVDYSQGNDFDVELETLNDIHKPQLDGMGFQDLTANKIAWWKPKTEAIGKQPAWIDYMTNFNKVYGNFAIEDNEAFMVLNRIYEPENGDYKSGALNYSTYVNPEDFIYTFAEQSVEAQDFWIQLGFGIEARRVMSAKQIPNL